MARWEYTEDGDVYCVGIGDIPGKHEVALRLPKELGGDLEMGEEFDVAPTKTTWWKKLWRRIRMKRLGTARDISEMALAMKDAEKQ
jgi:hypothetical protein